MAACEAYKISSYFRCNSELDTKKCIMEYGSVIVSADIPVKGFLKRSISKKDYTGVGGHAFILVGWDENGWIAQDSYSIFRPFFGRFHINYDYPINEFWGLII